ncbi:LysE family translocator [Leisingera sp. SS27]|uniref:LysE family translocator n=1 Tax=Leisingera sp. SS27 TaxID=2979462 RepID=UPI00232EC83F|nr:LysE family translocator [Leisingera sp. SS27]MDC0659510.1 LysE family translocator [Leisingera sp. SS27]
MTFDLETFAAVIAVYVMIVISPGPNFVLITRYSLRHPVPLAFAVTFGLAAGATINASITMFGVGSLIVAYPLFGFLVSVAGGGFMGYLGLSAIVSALRERTQLQPAGHAASVPAEQPEMVPEAAPAGERLVSALNKGLLVNLLNPKGIVFFIGLYAPLIARTSLATKGAVLAASFLIEILWYGLVILILARPRFRRMYERASFSIDCLLGLVLLLIGMRILLQAGTYL